MKPDDFNQPTGQTDDSHKQAAASIIRSQIDRLYDGDQIHEVEPSSSVYDQTYSDEAVKTDDEHWKKYHTAWQDFYQKYYEGYYVRHLDEAKKQLKGPAEQPKQESFFGGEANGPEAVAAIKQDVLTKVRDSAQRARKSRHFVPIISAIVVVVIFLFLQYNRVLISNVVAYVSPGNIDPQNIILDPSTASATVSSEPRLIIPKINVDVPVVYGIGPDHNSQMKAMEKGVAHFAIPGASSQPGETGNTVIAGHSSNDLFDRSQYKFIFAQLDRLEKGDMIYANFEGKRYSYVVTKKEVVKPSQVDKLVYPTDKPVMTLITCTPLGTAINRLLVTAEQVSPDPAQAAPAPEQSQDDIENLSMPNNTPSLLERLFGRS